jgi:hypothetical protein
MKSLYNGIKIRGQICQKRGLLHALQEYQKVGSKTTEERASLLETIIKEAEKGDSKEGAGGSGEILRF